MSEKGLVKRLAAQLDAAGYGYGNPPKETRWKPGQSGNPKGRPKGKSLAETFRAIAGGQVSQGDKVLGSPVEIIIKTMIERAIMAGNPEAARLVLSLARDYLPQDPGESESAEECAPACDPALPQ